MKGKNDRVIEELKLLLEISEMLDCSYDLRDELYPVLRAISDYTGMLRGNMTLLDKGTGRNENRSSVWSFK